MPLVLFENPQHEKAWIIRVTINQCKDFLKSFMRKQSVPIEDIVSVTYPSETGCPDVLEAVLSLPQKYKDVIYLHYYEGYSAAEISKILGKNVNTVYTLTARAKDKLKAKLGGCEIE